MYETDWDDDFDCTFAHWQFKVPDKFRDKILKLHNSLSGALKFATPQEKFDISLKSLKGEKIQQKEFSNDEIDNIDNILSELQKEVFN